MSEELKEYSAEETAANRKKWTDALRSGNYRQGDSYLHQGDRFCCLGVACDVAIKDGLEMATEKAYDADDIMAYDGVDAVLPGEVVRWLGLADQTGELREFRDGSDGDVPLMNLWHLNDRARLSFGEIADIIDRGEVKLAGEEDGEAQTA